MLVTCDNCRKKYRITIKKNLTKPISFKCGKCGHLIRVSPEQTAPAGPSGKDLPSAETTPKRLETVKATCPKCGNVFVKAAQEKSPICYQCRIDSLVSKIKQKYGVDPSEPAEEEPRYTIRSADGLVIGPIKLKTVKELAAAKKIKGTEDVAKDGDEFKPLMSFPELAEFFPELKEIMDTTGLEDKVEEAFMSAFGGALEEETEPSPPPQEEQPVVREEFPEPAGAENEESPGRAEEVPDETASAPPPAHEEKVELEEKAPEGEPPEMGEPPEPPPDEGKTEEKSPEDTTAPSEEQEIEKPVEAGPIPETEAPAGESAEKEAGQEEPPSPEPQETQAPEEEPALQEPRQTGPEESEPAEESAGKEPTPPESQEPEPPALTESAFEEPTASQDSSVDEDEVIDWGGPVAEPAKEPQAASAEPEAEPAGEEPQPAPEAAEEVPSSGEQEEPLAEGAGSLSESPVPPAVPPEKVGTEFELGEDEEEPAEAPSEEGEEIIEDLEPIPEDARYRIRYPDGLILGPVKFDTIKELLETGNLTGQEEVQREEEPWKSFVEWPELAELLGEGGMEEELIELTETLEES